MGACQRFECCCEVNFTFVSAHIEIYGCTLVRKNSLSFLSTGRTSTTIYACEFHTLQHFPSLTITAILTFCNDSNNTCVHVTRSFLFPLVSGEHYMVIFPAVIILTPIIATQCLIVPLQIEINRYEQRHQK